MSLLFEFGHGLPARFPHCVLFQIMLKQTGLGLFSYEMTGEVVSQDSCGLFFLFVCFFFFNFKCCVYTLN